MYMDNINMLKKNYDGNQEISQKYIILLWLRNIRLLLSDQCNNDYIFEMRKAKSQTISRSQMIAWINRTLNINQTRIENLGTGVVYCMILNHFHPNAITSSKIINFPHSTNDYRTNLRRFQEGLASTEIRSITFDAFKASQMTYGENWALICKLYKIFSVVEREKSIISEPSKQSREQWKNQTPKNVDIKADNGCISNPPFFFNSLSTPMKSSKFLQDGKFRFQSMNTIEDIKKIVVVEGLSDREKVKELKRLLGLQQEETHESETELRDLLSDCKQKQEVIQID